MNFTTLQVNSLTFLRKNLTFTTQNQNMDTQKKRQSSDTSKPTKRAKVMTPGSPWNGYNKHDLCAYLNQYESKNFMKMKRNELVTLASARFSREAKVNFVVYGLLILRNW